MAQTLQDKQQIVSEIHQVAAESPSAIAADYHGLTVAQMGELRTRAKEQGVYIRVVKNTLARRALQDGNFQCMCDHFKGPLLLLFSNEDPGAVARLTKEFAKDHSALNVKLVAMAGQLMDASGLDRLASLPTREQALSLLLGLLQGPIVQFARTLNAVPTQLVRTLAAVQQKKAETAA